MNPDLKTILILDLDNDLSKKFCQINSKDFNIIGISNDVDKIKMDGISVIAGDLYKNTKPLINKILSKTELPVDAVINNFTKTDGCKTVSQFFNKNVTKPMCVIEAICDYWKKTSCQSDRKIINIHPLENGGESKIWKSAKDAFNSSSISFVNEQYYNCGIKYNIVNFTDINKKEYIHCVISVTRQLIESNFNGESIFINKENYTQIWLPVNSSIFKNDDTGVISDYKKDLTREKMIKLSRTLKRITNIKVVNKDFKYAIANRCVVDEIIRDIEDEFNEVLSNGLVSDINDKHFFCKKDNFFYSYIPDVCSKSFPNNSKLIFANNAFKEILEHKFEVDLSNEIYIEYLYKDPTDKDTDIVTGDGPAYFSSVSEPLSVAYDINNNQGLLNVHQSEIDYEHNSSGARVVRDKCLTVIIPLNKKRGDSDHVADGGMSLHNENKEIFSFQPKRHSMIIFENNSSSYHKFLSNSKAEKMMKICFHKKIKSKNEKKIINRFEIKLEEGGEFGFIPPISIVQKEI